MACSLKISGLWTEITRALRQWRSRRSRSEVIDATDLEQLGGRVEHQRDDGRLGAGDVELDLVEELLVLPGGLGETVELIGDVQDDGAR